MNLAIPLLMLFLANSNKSASSASKRVPVKGRKSGRTWFVAVSQAGASRTPVSDVFANATGNELVISFAALPGGIRARMFVSPSTLAPVALLDFDVSEFKAGKL